ncbi:MAG: hypothetical protein HQL84_15150 [Magnetococcales bacterium]|nr:hypothetical protein [Magnetococcales bacterium]MBF0151357.1 hypothetical protein [Magnetococcales bacterium]MBF0175055.1 hypothetical protein [Magnetococcales bacterium]MBF0632380.1 hypothetical protein [Magnetococcales bacterium]
MRKRFRFVAENKKTILKKGEYFLNDPALLNQMRTAREVKVPGSEVVFAPKYTPIDLKLLERLERRGIQTLFAETIQEQSVVSTVAQMEQMFNVIETIVSKALSGIDDVAQSVQNRQQLNSLEQMIRENLDEIDNLFACDPTEKLMALTQHHGGTARHSIIASFHLMAIGHELGWSDEKIVRGAVAVFNHDIGKTKIKLETLDWPGKLDSKQWKEMQLHTLHGGRLLYRSGQAPDLAMLTALLHHEWFANVKGKGYGGLTLFADYLKKNLNLDMPKIIASLDRDDLDVIQASSLVDMVSALEESRAYKRQLDSFKVLIIMNTDAMMGHFNPEHYAAWHRIYMRQNPDMLPKGRRFALPREKERRIFHPHKPKKIHPVELLTFHELEQLGFMPVLRNVGMDVERIRRRGGLSLKVVEQMKRDKNLDFDCSREAIEAAGITLLKSQVVTEQEMIELDAWREWLTWDELERAELLAKLKAQGFDLATLRSDRGISVERLARREISLNMKKMERLGIQPLKEWVVKLPGSENRLTPEDLKKLGITDQQLQKAGCLERVKKVKSGVPLVWLANRGIVVNNAVLAKNGIDPVRKVFYDIHVVEEIDHTRAKFILLKEGDDLKDIMDANGRGELEPIQDLLYNQVGEIVMDFSDLLALPDLSRITLGEHWQGKI